MKLTIEQWLNELPEPYRSQALENMVNYPLQELNFHLKSMNDKVGSMSDAIDGFDWARTDQGFNYWDFFLDSLLNEMKS